jgi:hypothetical protein
MVHGVASEVLLWFAGRIEQSGHLLWFGANVARVSPISAILCASFVAQFFVIGQGQKNELLSVHRHSQKAVAQGCARLAEQVIESMTRGF